MKMKIIKYCVFGSATRVYATLPHTKYPCNITRRPLSLSLISTTFSALIFSLPLPPSYSSPSPSSKRPIADFSELPNSGGVKALELLVGSGEVPQDGDQVEIHYYGRLAAKQGWRFDSTYDHKDENGDPNPFVFVLGSGKVIAGIDVAVRSMKVGGIRRVVIPPSLGYQNTSQEPIPPNFFDRQRLFTTIFNPTRLANGEGSTLGTLIFDIELVGLRHQ
ncbi:putative peptidylprolyl isomerase [Medicago truncatula]|uniref:peptidylprolyl isomerase n=1 Tax=Medicago truncatula TaxID=3880 RepID=A0A072VKD1_MEDTR|nr:peptidyl-prolyl cis-trans isomerase FKBP17-1, chloroplastic isoform X1 [Medicago truncatula]KEH42091.1 FKBP-type peptidyl-prolyl cis-trans isomerase [Medicago truncatula]RHN79612.1 putative peptidylprolyl isomerase [Medicago truncatula]